MPTSLFARVIPEDGDAFDAPVANLTPSSLFLFTGAPLAFKQALTLEMGEISIHGEVAFTCAEPNGVVVAFRASADALHVLEDFMDDTPVLVGGHTGTTLEQFQAMSDAELDALPDSDPEGPTNTEGEPVEDEGEDPARDPAREVREAFHKSKFPPNLATERVGKDDLIAAQNATLARRRGDRDPTVVPALDQETDSGLEDSTVSGGALEGAEAAEPSVSDAGDEPDERTVVPERRAEDAESTQH